MPEVFPTLPALGLAKRMGRLFDPRSGNCIIIAIDHGVFMGPLPGIERLDDVARVCADNGADALQVGPRAAQWIGESLIATREMSLVLRVDSTNAYHHPRPKRLVGSMILSIEDAVASGADAAVVYYLDQNADPEEERDNVARLAETLRDSRRAGMPLMIEPLVMGGSGESVMEGSQVDRVTRMAYELGADLLKIDYPGEDALKAIVNNVAAPVLIRGGPKVSDFNDFVRAIGRAMEVGARGVVFGRNIWQAPDVGAAMRALVSAVHGREHSAKDPTTAAPVA